MGNTIQFQLFTEENFQGPKNESGHELKRRILNEFKVRARKRPGRKPTGRVTLYMIEALLREGRKEEADALSHYITRETKGPHPEIKYTSEDRLEQRYRARKAREREARELLQKDSSRTICERNETVRFQVSAEILQKAEGVANESGLSVGEMCRVILASIAGVGFEQRMGPAQATYPFWKLNGKI